MTPNARRAALFIAGRLLAMGALLAVSVYYLLASVPFAYYHFLQFAHFWWLPWFVRLHPVVMMIGAGLLLATLGRLSRAWRGRLAVLATIGAGWMQAMVSLPSIQSFETSAVLCGLPLLLLGAGTSLDLGAERRSWSDGSSDPRPADRHRAVTMAALAGGGCALLYLVVGMAALRRGGVALSIQQALGLAAFSAVAHALAFAVPPAALALVERVAVRQRSAPGIQLSVSVVCVAAIVALLVQRVALSTLMLGPWFGGGLSLGIGITAALLWQSTLRGYREVMGRAAPEPIRWLPAQSDSQARWITVLVGATVVYLSVFVLPGRLLLADWGAALHSTLVLLTWIAATLVVRALPDQWRISGLAAGLAAIVAVTALTTRLNAAGRPSSDRPEAVARDWRLTFDTYTAGDASLATIIDMLRPAMRDREFFTALQRTGDATDRPSLVPAPLRIDSNVSHAASAPPHVFVFVIDSLRADYLSPYSPEAATFTPAIEAFARESIVMRNAFTAYAGTALSQPAIWAGGLIPRLNYPQPFSRLNNLERLLAAGGYRRYVSMDQISKTTLSEQDSIVNLEAAIEHPERDEEAFKFDLCTTLETVTREISRHAGDGRPVFVFSQPQNLHIRVLATAETTRDFVVTGGRRFFRPAMTATARLDQCFGGFINYLKQQRMYDDSIVVLTSDHGDMYGDGGKWGHAYYLTPETLRVPLIIHVPEPLRRQRSWDENAVAFTTGITPTLFDLLGDGQLDSAGPVGRPFSRASGPDDTASSSGYLVQSSYSRAFGLLGPRGEWLYVADANQSSETLYQRTADSWRVVPLETPARARYRQSLLEKIDQLNRFYVRN